MELQNVKYIFFVRPQFTLRKMGGSKKFEQTTRNRSGQSCILRKKQRVVMPVTRDARVFLLLGLKKAASRV